jgi:methyl coenzyme M reductase subunit C
MHSFLLPHHIAEAIARKRNRRVIPRDKKPDGTLVHLTAFQLDVVKLNRMPREKIEDVIVRLALNEGV